VKKFETKMKTYQNHVKHVKTVALIVVLQWRIYEFDMGRVPIIFRKQSHGGRTTQLLFIK